MDVGAHYYADLYGLERNMKIHQAITLVILVVLGSGLSAAPAYADWGRGNELKRVAEQRPPAHEGARNVVPEQRQRMEQFRDATPEQRQQWRNQNPEQARQMREDANNRFQERWKRADENGSGRITRQDAARHMPGVSKHFDEIDANHDGVVTQDEVRAFRQRRAQDRLNQDSGRDPRY
jgi:TolA-binding protein